jgi:hypothetical protein
MLGVDTDTATLTDGWCQSFLADYETTQSIRGEELLNETVQRDGSYRGTPRESISALLITLATADEIALRKDDQYITEPEAIGRSVRNKTNLTDIQIRFESLGGLDPDQIRETVQTIMGEPPVGSDPDAWLSELAEWINNNSVLVRSALRGVSREFDENASLDALDDATTPALSGEALETEDLGSDKIETQAERFARAKEIFQPDADDETLWDQFNEQKSEMQRLHPGADVSAEMQAVSGGTEIPDGEQLQELIEDANDHRQDVVQTQYERITGETPTDMEPESIVSSLSTWLFAHDGSSKETADRVSVEFDGVSIDALYELFELAWDGDSFGEADLVNPTVIQQAKRYETARRLLEASGGEDSLWSQLRDAAKQLDEEYPTHPITSEIKDTLSQSQPPSVDEVEQLIEDAEDPFKIEERLAELAVELQAEYPDHDLTDVVVDAVEGDSSPSEDRMSELIKEAERLLGGSIEKLRKIRETMDDLPDGSVVMIDLVN